MRKRTQRERESGRSVMRVHSAGRWAKPRDPAALNGSVYLIREGKAQPKHLNEHDRYPSPKLRLYILQRDHYRCFYCGAGLTNRDANTDHKTPWKLGGKTTKANLVACCQDCNKAKGNNPNWRFGALATA